MHFNLPDQLALEVASYDETRKKLAATMAAQNPKTRKQSFSSGRPSNMFPSHIIKDSDWEEAVLHINKQKAPEKVRLFTKPVFGKESEPIAIVYYNKQLWVAAWFPKTADDTYIYGLTIAYRDTAAGRKACGDSYINNSRKLGDYMYNQRGDESDMLPRIKDGRAYWYRKTILFTKELIQSGYTNDYWKAPNRSTHYLRSWGATSDIYRHVVKWENQLRQIIPQFKGGNDDTFFSRLDPNNCTLESIMSKYWSRPRWMNHNDSYVHDVDHIIGQIRKWLRQDYYQDLLSAKWFRSLILNAMKEVEVIHENETAQNIYDREAVKRPFGIIYQFLSSVLEIKPIYRDIDLNLLHSRYDWLSKCDLPGYHSETGYNWMRDNLPVESFLNMLYQKYKQATEERERREKSGGYFTGVDDSTGNYHVYMHEWRDTYQMLTQCITANRIDNLKPKRWRMTEWHDHLMAETWKINHPKIDLPQKLFPQPIKVEQCNDGVNTKYAFFQPIDTHQLAAWGRAAHNCVGNCTTYADGVKKMKHLIVLTMIDNAPRYTIQLKVDNGVLTVAQIGDVSNKRLDYDERDKVEDAFKTALTLREEQLS